MTTTSTPALEAALHAAKLAYFRNSTTALADPAGLKAACEAYHQSRLAEMADDPAVVEKIGDAIRESMVSGKLQPETAAQAALAALKAMGR